MQMPPWANETRLNSIIFVNDPGSDASSDVIQMSLFLFNRRRLDRGWLSGVLFWNNPDYPVTC
jgi:hypothetical protein